MNGSPPAGYFYPYFGPKIPGYVKLFSPVKTTTYTKTEKKFIPFLGPSVRTPNLTYINMSHIHIYI